MSINAQLNFKVKKVTVFLGFLIFNNFFYFVDFVHFLNFRCFLGFLEIPRIFQNPGGFLGFDPRLLGKNPTVFKIPGITSGFTWEPSMRRDWFYWLSHVWLIFAFFTDLSNSILFSQRKLARIRSDSKKSRSIWNDNHSAQNEFRHSLFQI